MSIDEHVERRAIDVQSQLAAAGHHRLPPVDLLIAALAEHHRLGVLHYDRDYDLVADKTDLTFGRGRPPPLYAGAVVRS